MVLSGSNKPRSNLSSQSQYYAVMQVGFKLLTPEHQEYHTTRIVKRRVLEPMHTNPLLERSVNNNGSDTFFYLTTMHKTKQIVKTY